jgi:hypothetical protein
MVNFSIFGMWANKSTVQNEAGSKGLGTDISV